MRDEQRQLSFPTDHPPKTGARIVKAEVTEQIARVTERDFCRRRCSTATVVGNFTFCSFADLNMS